MSKPTSTRATQAVSMSDIEAVAKDRYKVVHAHESVFWSHAVVAGDGTQQIYTGRKVECENMAAKFAGAFLDGAFLALAQTEQPKAAPIDMSCPADEAQEDGEWITEAKKTLNHLSAFLQDAGVPHAVCWRDWIDNARTHLIRHPGAESEDAGCEP